MSQLRGLVRAGVVVAVIALALVAGSALATRRAAVAPPAALDSATASPTVAAQYAPVRAAVTRAQAIALVRSLGEVMRVDRIEAKLVPWAEFAPVGMGVDRTGGPQHGGGIPIPAVWAVAVSGEAKPNLGDRVPQVTYPWVLYGINPIRASVATLKVDTTGAWPPGFDALADHVALAPTPDPPSPAPLRLGAVLSGVRPLPPIRDLAAADTAALQLWAVVGANADRPRLMRSDVGGASWRTVPNDPTRGSGPAHVAAAGSLILVSDLGLDTAASGASTSGGLFLSKDGGATWTRIDDVATGGVVAMRWGGTLWFFVEHPWASSGAATGPSRISASTDGEIWRNIGEVPGPASFGMLDVPLVSFSKNVPGDGIFRVEGTDLTSLRLVAIPGSRQVSSLLTSAPRAELWSFRGSGAAVSSDGGRTWRDASRGLAGRLAGLFSANGIVYAIGDGAYYWNPDQAEWLVADVRGGKTGAVFQFGDRVILQDLPGGLWRYPP